MNKIVPIGSVIQGAELLSNDCYRNENDELIIPEGVYLGNVFNQMPYGRIDKKVPGIGATTLELDSERNSIIVVPTQYLADSKSKSSGAFYVGGNIEQIRYSPTENQLNRYMRNDTIEHKKLIVVADSLPRVMRHIGKDLNNWFIMLDEIDCFQEQSNFRKSLEIAIDYYLLFDKKRRCMVSATLKEFSNNQLQSEELLIINYPESVKRNIKIISTSDVNETCINQIIYLSDNIYLKSEKVVIAYNSVKDAREIIDLLFDPFKTSCKILCSKYNVEAAGDFFGELQDGRLPAEINFITSAYYTGIDIYDEYHLLYVSTIKKPHTLFSIDKTYQIYGRSRLNKELDGIKRNGVLSETLIHDAFDKVKPEYTSVKLIVN